MDSQTTITTEWDELREMLTIKASHEGFDVVHFWAGFAPNYYTREADNELYLGDLPHATEKFIYIRTVAIVEGEEQLETEKFAVVPIEHPILGVVKTCDGETRYIVDFVEKKNGKITDRWKSGERVVNPCDETFYLLTEAGEPIMTEFNQHIVTGEE